MPADQSTDGLEHAPNCQTKDCWNDATALLRSRITGTELHLCRGHASKYHEQGWKKIRGQVQLRTGEE